MNNYTFDRCLVCNKHKALKNGICVECANKDDLPDCLKEIFKEFKNE